MKKDICVVVASRANYGRVKYLMKAIDEHPDLNLKLILGASTLLDRFGKAEKIIKEDGFNPIQSIYYVIEGETLTTQAKSTGLGIIELASSFENLNPHLVITVADRFETMATAIAASYMNIPLAHLQGGEISGNIDDRVRHAITQLSDYHFVCTEQSAQKVISMGISTKNVFNYGCPAMDILQNEDLMISNKIMYNYKGVGYQINWEEPYILIMQHPVTTSYGDGFNQISKTLNSTKMIKDMQKIVMWPNIDAGSDEVSKGIRVFRENNKDEKFNYQKNFSPEIYAKVLNNAKCCVGNSSSFIREGSFLGVPSVIIGDRQRGREHGSNVLFSDYDKESIKSKVEYQISKNRYKKNNLFGDGNAGILIANKIAEIL
tara:strand:- start:2188 stop:3312 length:1125 start_codon:yes stop_codon:yes gene_type:complete